MMRCTECDNEAVVCYCGFKAVTKENYRRALRECKDLRCYCKIHLSGIETSLKPMLVFSKSRELPEEFVRWIESDLNKVIEVLPEFLEKNYKEITKNQNYPHQFEFLMGWCIGICESSFCHAYQHEYKKIPSEFQVIEIRKIISRRRIQFEQGVFEFLKENDGKIK